MMGESKTKSRIPVYCDQCSAAMELGVTCRACGTMMVADPPTTVKDALACVTSVPPPTPPAGCPTAEELWLTYRKETTDEHLAWGDIEKADSGHGFRAVESLVASRWPRVVMPSREEIARADYEATMPGCKWSEAKENERLLWLMGADAVLSLLRPVAATLDPVELASRIRKSGMTVVNPAGLAAIAIAYFNGKMGQGEAGAPSGSPPVSVVSPHSEPGSDAPPAPSLMERLAPMEVEAHALLVKPPVPSYAERRAALVKKCKEVCPKCAEWSFDAKDARWAIVYELDSDSACTDIRREIAALDAENEKAALKKALYSTEPALDAEEAAKAKAPPAPDESLNAEALALCKVLADGDGLLDLVDDVTTNNLAPGMLALAREVRRQKAEELEAIVMEPCDSHTSKLYARIAKLRGEQHGK